MIKLQSFSPNLIIIFLTSYSLCIACDDSSSSQSDPSQTQSSDQFSFNLNADMDIDLINTNQLDSSSSLISNDMSTSLESDSMIENIRCDIGVSQCVSEQIVQECIAGTWIQSTCESDQRCQNGSCVSRGTTECTTGEARGCFSSTAREVCDETGMQFISEECPMNQVCYLGECGTQICEPNRQQCSPDRADTILVCDEVGENWVVSERCTEDMICQAGRCVTNQCDLAAKLKTYIGCEYWTVDLDNYPDPFTIPMPNEVPHSVVLSNPGTMEATIRFETRSGEMVQVDDPIIPAGEVRAFTMPRLDVDGSGITLNSIRILSSMPVNAYQFNPLNNSDVYSNDASLLLPVSSLGRRHIIASWSTGVDTSQIIPIELVPQAGYFTVVAVSPGVTEVTVTMSANTTAGPGVPALVSGEQYTFQLDQFQVLNLEAEAFTPADFPELFTGFVYDLTGTVVDSSQPVAVFGGHEEAVISYQEQRPGANSYCCADHLEEQLFPVDVWTNEVLCAKVKPRSSNGEKDLWRIFSGAEGNQITTIPPIDNLNGIQLNYGEWVQIESEHSFQVNGTGAVMAVQYIISQEQTDERKGDPSMILAVPTGQYRSDYTILVPEGYNEDWVTVIRPIGLEITVDGTVLNESFISFANGQWEMAYVQLNSGIHTFVANDAFGLIAYGWNQAVSYGYPAGLNLRSPNWMP
jgi:hypothetical protein